MQTDNNAEHEQAQDKEFGQLGQQLKAAREKFGFSVSDVNMKLKISNAVIVALEENNADDTVEPIFIKGYLRQLAKLYGRDDEEFLRIYVAQHQSDSDNPLTSTRSIKRQAHSGDFKVKLFSWLLILGIAGLAGLWWTQQHQETDQGDSTAATPAIQSHKPTPVLHNGHAELSLPDESTTAPTVSKVDASTSDDTQADSNINKGKTAAENAKPTAIQPALETKSQPQPLVTALAFKLHAKQASWVEIKDADGKRLYYDIISTGQTRQLRGKAPISIFLGNAEGIEISIDGKPFNSKGFMRANKTARFKLQQL